MHNLPGTGFGSKDQRSPQGVRDYIFPSADPGGSP
jgi:hypothetical protein